MMSDVQDRGRRVRAAVETGEVPSRLTGQRSAAWRRWPVVWGVVTAVVVVGALPGVAGAVVGRSPVKAVPAPVFEHDPSADAPYFSWVHNTGSHPNEYNVYAQIGSGAAFRVNPAGTQARGGGISGSTLAYQLLGRHGSDIALYDLATRRRLPTPRLNTPRTEWRPSVSGDWLLFGRDGRLHRRILLMNLKSGLVRILSVLPVGFSTYSEPDQINGNYAVYMRCKHLPVCNAWRYNVSTRTAVRMSNPHRLLHSAPSVAKNGTVYLDESGFSCGQNTRIKEYQRGRSPTIVWRFPKGIDTDTTFVDESTPTPRLLYTRSVCGGPQDMFVTEIDIYQARPIRP